MKKGAKQALLGLWLLLGVGGLESATRHGLASTLPPDAGESTVVASAARFQGPDGEPLPFTDDEEIKRYLSTAEVVSTRQLSSGVNRPLKVLLAKDGLEAHAVFRTVDKKKDRVKLNGRSYRAFHDSYIYECAAYELSRLLGLDSIPPCVRRRIGGSDGTLQLWVEGAMTEKERLDSNQRSPHPLNWARQRQTMYLFDSLIYNFDRNQGNILITPDWKMWLIDHTRSFRMDNEIAALKRIIWCEESTWEKLQTLDMSLLKDHLNPYVDRFQLKGLLKRRDRIVRSLEERAQEFGSDAVFYHRDAESPMDTDEVAAAAAEDSLPAHSGE